MFGATGPGVPPPCLRARARTHCIEAARRPYVPGDRGLWLKTKCVNHEEFVVIGWTDPEGGRPFIRALPLGHYDQSGRLDLCRAGREPGCGPISPPTFCVASDRCRSRKCRRCRAAALNAVRLAAGAVTGPLGPARACRRGQIPDVHRGRALASGRLSGGIREDRPAREVVRQTAASVTPGA